MRTYEKHSQAPGLTAAQRQRAVGAVVAAATGDALGAPYEFQAPVVDSEEIAMIGGGVLGYLAAAPLEALLPVQRAVLLLRDVFDHDVDDWDVPVTPDMTLEVNP